ncbi:MAG: hypothetical protein ABWY78_05685 [Microvirga sp.]
MEYTVWSVGGDGGNGGDGMPGSNGSNGLDGAPGADGQPGSSGMLTPTLPEVVLPEVVLPDPSLHVDYGAFAAFFASSVELIHPVEASPSPVLPGADFWML